mgnify:CR=1 FL=1
MSFICYTTAVVISLTHIANKYIIKGDKGEPKSIEVNRALLNVSILEKRFSVK